MRNVAGIEIRSTMSSVTEQNLDTPSCARATLYSHLAHITDKLARGTEDARLIEQAPVKAPTVLRGGIEVRQSDGSVSTDNTIHFLIETAPGHKVIARRLVVSQGIIGTDGEYARITPQFHKLNESHPGRFLMLGNDNDLETEAEGLAATLTSLRSGQQPSQQLVVRGRLLHSPDIHRALAFYNQRPDSHIMVKGSRPTKMPSRFSPTTRV